MMLTKLKIIAVVLLLAIVACSGTAVVGRTVWAALQSEPAKKAPANQGAIQPPDKKDAPAAVKESMASAPLKSGPPFIQFAHKAQVTGLLWATDGKSVATATETGTITIIDTGTGKEITSFEAGNSIGPMAFSPDGKTLAIMEEQYSLCIWNKATGQLEKKRGGIWSPRPPEHLAWTADGELIVGVGVGAVYDWGLISGGGVTVVLIPPGPRFAAIAADASAGGWINDKGYCSLFRYDNKPGFQPRFQQTTGLEVGKAECIAFGSGGKLLAVGTKDKDVHLWDLAARKLSSKLNGLEKAAINLSFSANAATLAALAGDSTTIRIWDVPSSTVRCQINHSCGIVGAMAMSPDGKILATLKDGKWLMLWKANARGLVNEEPGIELSAMEMASLWTNLTSADFQKADAAFRKLGAGGDNAVAFLGKQIRAIAVPDTDIKQIEKLVAELDSDKFATRENAGKELTALGELAIVPLQRLLDKSPSTEAKQRATLILKKIGEPALTPERLRVLDAIDLLEQMQSAKVVSMLQEIERDALIPQIRTEAQRALQRLGKWQREKR